MTGTSPKWRAMIEALPDSTFPIVYRTGIRFESRADMVAGFEWFAENGAGKFRDDMDNVDWSRHSGLVAMQWKQRKAEQDRAATAREAQLAPLKANREKRAADRAASQLKKRKATIANLQEDLAATCRLLLTQLKPGYGNIDWPSVEKPVAHLSSIQTRLRFQVESARRKLIREEVGL